MTNRLHVRLDAEHRRCLEEVAQESGTRISQGVRRLIDGAYEDILRPHRKQAVELLIGLNVEDPPEPDTLSRELEEAHEPRGFIDANVPTYAARRDYPYKEPCARILRIPADGPKSFVTDSEVLQELMHRYLASGRWTLGGGGGPAIRRENAGVC